jgi:hypothetical protein
VFDTCLNRSSSPTGLSESNIQQGPISRAGFRSRHQQNEINPATQCLEYPPVVPGRAGQYHHRRISSVLQKCLDPKRVVAFSINLREAEGTASGHPRLRVNAAQPFLKILGRTCCEQGRRTPLDRTRLDQQRRTDSSRRIA